MIMFMMVGMVVMMVLLTMPLILPSSKSSQHRHLLEPFHACQSTSSSPTRASCGANNVHLNNKETIKKNVSCTD